MILLLVSTGCINQKMTDSELQKIADRLQNSADRVEAAARRLIELLEKQKLEEEESSTRPQFGDVG